MVGRTVRAFATAASEISANTLHEAIWERAEAIAVYRGSLSPWLIDGDNTLRVKDMLDSALYGEWALKTPEGHWLSIEEISWGTRLPQLEVANVIIGMLYHKSLPLFRCHINGVARYSLGMRADSGRDSRSCKLDADRLPDET